MDDTTKYLIHARIAANGVVERSDVVGAVFGQTEGLLGNELDLRDLQQSSKVGRIDVQISSENGQSFGTLTIATSLDKAETAILGASLETIERVGPCRADLEVTQIEDVRAAKRREVISRAKELLATAFDETVISTEELVADVRESVRVEDIVEYEGLPAGPSVATSDAIIVVEGRADVLQLLKYGIKNAIAVEGTNVPDAVGALTADRTTTVFVDGDRGGELILRELLQVGDVDFVAFAPPDQSVEDLSRSDVLTMLRQKVAASRLTDVTNIRETIAGLLGDSAESTNTQPASDSQSSDSPTEVEVVPTTSAASAASTTDTDRSEPPADETEIGTETAKTAESAESATTAEAVKVAESAETVADSPSADSSALEPAANQPATLRSHVSEVIADESDIARVLGADFSVLAESDLDGIAAAIDAVDEPFSLVLDGELSQRLLDIAAQHGIDHIVARSTGEFVKKPVGTRVLTADDLQAPEPEIEA